MRRDDDPRWLPGYLLRLLACPVCHARLTEPCRSASGNARPPHPTRVLGRRCPCGRSPVKGSLYCSPGCVAKARRESYERREIRTPTRLRRRGPDVVQGG